MLEHLPPAQWESPICDKCLYLANKVTIMISVNLSIELFILIPLKSYSQTNKSLDYISISISTKRILGWKKTLRLQAKIIRWKIKKFMKFLKFKNFSYFPVTQISTLKCTSVMNWFKLGYSCILKFLFLF